VVFLKVLKGPTFIKFFENFQYKNKMYIVMEYATRGNLDERVKLKKEETKKNPAAAFTKEVILRYLS